MMIMRQLEDGCADDDDDDDVDDDYAEVENGRWTESMWGMPQLS